MEKKEEKIEVTGTIIKSLPNTLFQVQLDNSKKIIVAHICGKMRINYIKLFPGDKVKIELSPYDLTKGRITYRLK